MSGPHANPPTDYLRLIVLRELMWHAQDRAASIRKRHGSETAAAAYDDVADWLKGLL